MNYLKIIVVIFALLHLLYSCKEKNKPIGLSNGDFEQWDSLVYWIPVHTLGASNPRAYIFCGSDNSLLRTDDAQSGKYAVQLTSLRSSFQNMFGYFTNCHLYGRANTWLGGVSYKEKPSGITGFYKCNIPSGDSGTIAVNFKKKGKSIGYYEVKFTGAQNSWTPFSYTFNPPLLSEPDTFMFCAISGNGLDSLFIPAGGGTLFLDNIKLTGVEHQPADFDGNFEQWEKVVYRYPRYWTVHSGHGEGIVRTTDAYKGKYALQLTTFLGDIDGTPSAEIASVSNSTWNATGRTLGFPFSRTAGTVTFYYKYKPVIATDIGMVEFSFKRKSEIIKTIAINLKAVSDYQKEEVPFNLQIQPDTIFINILSTNLTDSEPRHAGAALTIDELMIK